MSVLSFSHQYHEQQQGPGREGEKEKEGEGQETNPPPVITVEEQAAAAASALAGGMKGKSAVARAQVGLGGRVSDSDGLWGDDEAGCLPSNPLSKLPSSMLDLTFPFYPAVHPCIPSGHQGLQGHGGVQMA
jgi:hypothetical protein